MLGRFEKLVDKYKRILFIAIVFLLLFVFPSVWLSIKHGAFITVCDYQYLKYFFGKLRFEVLLGSLISLIGIIVSFLILHSVGLKHNIENIDDFLEHLIIFLDKADINDTIIILTPTLYFGKVTKNTNANLYLKIAEDKFNTLKDVKIYSKSFEFDKFCKCNNKDECKNELNQKISELEKKISDNSTDNEQELLYFHIRLFKSRNDDPDDINYKIEYFKGLCDLYTIIIKNNSIKKEFDQNDLIDANIILFLNTKKGKGIIGVFDEEDNYSLNANYIENKKSVDALLKLFTNHNTGDNE